MIDNDVILTESQQRAVEKINEFMNTAVSDDINTRVFRLTGAAGTGKSFVIKYALKEYIEADLDTQAHEGLFSYYRVLGVTVTHKAKNILSKSIPNCNTFAATFGLSPYYHGNGNVSFKRQKVLNDDLDCKQRYKVFVHDEFSMYNQDMLDTILTETNPNSKIIMIGDIFQNPPVMEGADNDKDSPVMDLPLSNNNCENLTEIVRQSQGNPIIELGQYLRDQIEGSQDIVSCLKMFKEDRISDGVGYRVIALNEVLDAYKDYNYHNSKVAVYRNDTVNKYNNALRDIILNKPNDIFVENELIYMNQTYISFKKYNAKMTFSLFNSEEYEIKTISKAKHKGVEVYQVYVQTEGHDNLVEKDPFFYIPTEEGRMKYEELKNNLLSAAKVYGLSRKDRSNAWKKYYEFENSFGNVSYGYCYSGHKLQGSTFENVFIDVNDIISVRPISKKRKLQALYTALTRSSKETIFLKK